MKTLYDFLITLLTQNWAAFLVKNPQQGRLIRDIFFNSIYGTSGLVLFLVCLFSVLLYYFYFNKRFGSYYSTKSWFKWMFFTALVIGTLTFIAAWWHLRSFATPTFPLIGWLSVINFVYSFFVFFIFSLICQVVSIIVRRLTSYDISPMASRTPI